MLAVAASHHAALPSASQPAALQPPAPGLKAAAFPATTLSADGPLAPDQALQDGERCVCELTSDLDLAQSKLSFHLRVLKEASLIRARQQGRWIYYRLEPAAMFLVGH